MIMQKANRSDGTDSVTDHSPPQHPSIPLCTLTNELTAVFAHLCFHAYTI